MQMITGWQQKTRQFLISPHHLSGHKSGSSPIALQDLLHHHVFAFHLLLPPHMSFLLICPTLHSLKWESDWLTVTLSHTVIRPSLFNALTAGLASPGLGQILILSGVPQMAGPQMKKHESCSQSLSLRFPGALTMKTVSPRDTGPAVLWWESISLWTRQSSGMTEHKPLSSALWFLPQEAKTSDHVTFSMHRGLPIPACKKKILFLQGERYYYCSDYYIMLEEKMAEVLQICRIKTREQDSVLWFLFKPHQFCSEGRENDRAGNL